MAEGGGLLNRYTGSTRIEGSNPSVSATHRMKITDGDDRVVALAVIAGPPTRPPSAAARLANGRERPT